MRTDLTAMCAWCSCRFSRGRAACPRCERDGLVDLRDGAQRAGAIAHVRERRRHAAMDAMAPVDLAGRTILIAGLGIVLAVFHPAFFLGVPLALAYILLANARRSLKALRGRDELARLDAPNGVAPRLLAPPEPEWHNELRGRIEVKVPVVAPVSGVRCAAFRLVGYDESGNAIDDAGAGKLELVTREGERLILAADAVLVQVDVGGLRHVTAPSDALRAFLADRGMPDATATWLREGVVLHGDEVIVRGRDGEDAAIPAGYRDIEWVRVLTHGDTRPLVIERVDPQSESR